MYLSGNHWHHVLATFFFFVVLTKYKKQWKGGRALFGVWSKEIHSTIEGEARWQNRRQLYKIYSQVAAKVP